ncbi:MAG: hypothetical protein ACTHK7_09915 [Aureliella sp.]
MRTITVATDRSSGKQALYVDGALKDQDSSLYADGIAPFTDGQPVLVENVLAYLPKECHNFPRSLEELNRVAGGRRRRRLGRCIVQRPFSIQ